MTTRKPLATVDSEVEFHPLTEAEVSARVASGEVNVVDSNESRSVASILRANILTRFNAIISILLVVILIFGHPADAMFGFVMIANALIGIVQELRAKATLDRLTVLAEPRVTVQRTGGPVEISGDKIVLGDILLLGRGEQVPVDGSVISAEGLEVSEALLTGEADAVKKDEGDGILSGSFVVSGTGLVGVTAVGASSYANQLAAEAKVFTLSSSELTASIDQILRIVTWLIIPTSALLLWSQLESGQSITDGIVGSVAGVVAMVPQGLVLLVSMSLAVAVVRLGKRNVLVQELPAVEMLARVSIIGVDKTGTLTSGRITFETVVSLIDSVDDVPSLLASIAASDPDPNATMVALGDAFQTHEPLGVVDRLPFSSERKTSAVAFDDGSAWIMGAPEFILPSVGAEDTVERIATFTSQGRRVLVVGATTPGGVASGDVVAGSPTLLLVFSEEIRPDAPDTVAYFTEQAVEIKVISGDAAATVVAVADSVGIPGTGSIDATTLPVSSDPAFTEAALATTVFGRVTPEQKRDLVASLQQAGSVVAMTGDGVNDVLAVKQADLGIAMGSGTGATRAVSQLVLLDDRFASLPYVVAEGRRVVANMERVASLFLTKTVYATLLAVLIGFIGLPFPFLPRHMTLVGAFTIGIPAFVLSFENQERPIRPGFTSRVLGFAIPAGVISGVFLFVLYGISRIDRFGFSLSQSRTGATTLMVVLGLVVLYELVSPPSLGHLLLIASLFAGYVLVLAVPIGQTIFELELPGVYAWVVIAAVSLVAGLTLKLLLVFSGRFVEAKVEGGVS
ncbi:MAG: cation-translocating P-type ATPase [Actinomycetia bacterium]|nr:cation-translocating P-type ATPase [Actinomycetes bacterium]